MLKKSLYLPGKRIPEISRKLANRSANGLFYSDQADSIGHYPCTITEYSWNDMDKIKDTAGVILAGGRSTRFGSNKAMTMVNGKPLIQNVADLMSSLFAECLLVTNTPEEYNFLSLPMTSDRYRECGPLAGIHAALMQISNPRAFVVACDMPNLSPELISYICRINEQQYDAIIPMLEKGQEPLFGIYHKRALPVIDKCLQQNACQIISVLEGLRVRQVSEEEVLSITDNLNCFKNINRPADL